jgi:hypothetical protein
LNWKGHALAITQGRSNFILRRRHLENVLRAIWSTLEFKMALTRSLLCLRLWPQWIGACHVTFARRSQMLQRSTTYPIKMAALVLCQLSLLAVLVWISQ